MNRYTHVDIYTQIFMQTYTCVLSLTLLLSLSRISDVHACISARVDLQLDLSTFLSIKEKELSKFWAGSQEVSETKAQLFTERPFASVA